MIIRITKHKSGFADYMRTGKRADSPFTREEKDFVIPLHGDLDLFKKTEDYLNKNKTYKTNYAHITISFSKQDREKLYDQDGNIKVTELKEIVKEVLNFYTAGYTENEIIAYAEAHFPKIKHEKDKLTGELKERFTHIHLAIAEYNPLLDNKLLIRPFNEYADNLLQTYIAKKYGFDLPIKHKRQKGKIELIRKELIKLLKSIRTEEELIEFFKINNIKYRKVETKKNCYYKIINPHGRDINLRGAGFKHLEEIAKKGFVSENIENTLTIKEKLKLKPLEELESEIRHFISKRDEYISKRSKKRSELLKEANKAEEDYTIIELNKEERKKLLEDTLKEAESLKIKRPTNIIENELIKSKDEQEKEKRRQELERLKKIPAKVVLLYAFKKFKINKNDYIVTENNKIKNKNNRQKPKSVIDFLTKECYLRFSEAIEELKKVEKILKQIREKNERDRIIEAIKRRERELIEETERMQQVERGIKQTEERIRETIINTKAVTRELDKHYRQRNNEIRKELSRYYRKSIARGARKIFTKEFRENIARRVKQAVTGTADKITELGERIAGVARTIKVMLDFKKMFKEEDNFEYKNEYKPTRKFKR